MTIKPFPITATTLFVVMAVCGPSIAADKIRHCDGEYRWETTGGSLNGEFGALTAYGKKSTAKNARKAARSALMDCFQAHWDERWLGKVPDRCKIGAKVERYDLKTTCNRRTDGRNPERICDNSGHGSLTRTIVDVPNGDLKQALEVQVCCLHTDNAGNPYPFGNEKSVFVRLSGHSWSTNTRPGYQQECNGARQLSDNYEINCQKVRDTICKRP